ncbi:OsmC family protein [Candidatus Xianfuyuplasma coldseepsis]|uniref:OsmC family protein n=1 Tax=Candidatus Xianfuyuplasma coldseepsis TaxID=2782163 RepID=A0A7L7KRD3_9MOLU|nr:OsmC family protein [Xianfuyuplasma coldseepsis]QMS85257.1 OsmC family protein [Xianfuyuplasma coldseepsis]
MLTTYKAKAIKSPEGLQVEAESRNFKISIDEPKSLGGMDTSMSPVEVLLCALGGCQAIVATAFAASHNVTFEDFFVEIEGDIDLDGFLGKADVRPGFQEVRYTMHFKTNEPREKMEKFVEFMERTCPVGDSIENEIRLVNAGIVII